MASFKFVLIMPIAMFVQINVWFLCSSIIQQLNQVEVDAKFVYTHTMWRFFKIISWKQFMLLADVRCFCEVYLFLFFFFTYIH